MPGFAKHMLTQSIAFRRSDFHDGQLALAIMSVSQREDCRATEEEALKWCRDKSRIDPNSVRVVIEAWTSEGNIGRHVVDPDASFMASIMKAAKNGHELVSALTVLADEGHHTLDRTSPTWRNNFE